MCTYHYLHHHHIPPCPKDLYFVIHYLFCSDATIDFTTGNRQPCSNAIYDDSHLASTAMSNSISTLSTSPTSSQSSTSTTCYYSDDGTPFPIDYTSLYSSTNSMSLSQQQPQHTQPQTMDFNNPCASSTCLTSLECSSGQCRLEQLGGKWTCCRCGGKGNEYAWCKARPGLVKGADPDMVCYHVICAGCRETGISGKGKGKGKR
ncbi:hypothetical protein QR685DRAFT_536741 [Neurospora intermedia]|uniref:Uncharacterized protein n=1 Tax=Neurospora intermedia TaxID=5142 RepID=A0ABR3D049_NEUIN